MRQPRLYPLVYNQIYPRPKPNDPSCFEHFICRKILPEVIEETERFHGNLQTLEAMYPGLDYTDPGHRLRLEQFTNHKKLFRAFDALRLTDQQIRWICRWDGTLYHRRMFEREHRMKIRDTTWDNVNDDDRIFLPVRSVTGATQPGSRRRRRSSIRQSKPDIKPPPKSPKRRSKARFEEKYVEEDFLSASVGDTMNAKLMAARERGLPDSVYDPAYDQWQQWLQDTQARHGVGNLDRVPAPGLVSGVPNSRSKVMPRTPSQKAAKSVSQNGAGRGPTRRTSSSSSSTSRAQSVTRQPILTRSPKANGVPLVSLAASVARAPPPSRIPVISRSPAPRAREAPATSPPRSQAASRRKPTLRTQPGRSPVAPTPRPASSVRSQATPRPASYPSASPPQSTTRSRPASQIRPASSASNREPIQPRQKLQQKPARAQPNANTKRRRYSSLLCAFCWCGLKLLRPG